MQSQKKVKIIFLFLALSINSGKLGIEAKKLQLADSTVSFY